MSEDTPRPYVACLKLNWAHPSEALVAEQWRAMERYTPLLLTASAPASLGLPADAVASLSRLNPVARGLNRLTLALGRTCRYFEGRVRQASCRLIHLQSAAEARYGLRLRARTRLPLVTSFDGSEAAWLPRRRPHAYDRLFAEGELFLACSESTRKRLLGLGCPDERLRVHHPGIDLGLVRFVERAPEEGGAVNILLVGQLVERKGLAYALQAFANVHRYQRRATLTIIGDGPERRTLEALLRELSLGQAVRVLGAQPHDVVLAEMQRAHLYVQPSVTTADGDEEGIPTALIEAMASGLPVVATWHAGIPEIVADGRSGYLVSERNSHALAERLRHLAEHPEKWEAFGRAGRAIVEERFNLRRQAARLEEYYDEVIARAS